MADDTVDLNYDLTRLLTDKFRSVDSWRDMAIAMSQVLYEKVEQNRIALSLAREPEVLARVFKTLASDMLGLDYHSSILSDNDYDRLLKFISIYNTEKGTKEFIHFMGFVKNMKLDLVPLWTTNYLDFTPGQPYLVPTVYDEEPGYLYPTTHVGLIYDELQVPVNTNGGIGEIDFEELTNLFYKLAPINLVLKWIAAVITIRLPTIHLGVQIVEEDWTTIVAYIQYIAVIWWAAQICETDKYDSVNAPAEIFLAEQLPQSVGVASTFASVEYDCNDISPIARWSMHESPYMPSQWTYTRNSEASMWDEDGVLVWKPANEPRLIAHNPSTHAPLGWMFEPPSTNYLLGTRDMTSNYWLYSSNIRVSKYRIGPDKISQTVKLEKQAASTGYFWQSVSLNQYVPFAFSVVMRENTSRFIAIKLRYPGGPSLIEAGLVVDLRTGNSIQINSGNIIKSNTYHLGGGLYRIWLSMNNIQSGSAEVRIYPAWANSLTLSENTSLTGAAEIWHAQFERGEQPTSYIRTNIQTASRAASYLMAPDAVPILNAAQGMVLMNYYSIYPDVGNQTLMHAYKVNSTEEKRFTVNNGQLGVKIVNSNVTATFLSPEPIEPRSTNRFGYTWDNSVDHVRLAEDGVITFNNYHSNSPSNLEICQISSNYQGGDGVFGYLQSILFSSLNPDNTRLVDYTTRGI